MTETETATNPTTSPIQLRGDNLAFMVMTEPNGSPLPIAQIVGAGGLFASSIALDDAAIDAVITFLEDIRRRRRGLVIAKDLPNGHRPP